MVQESTRIDPPQTVNWCPCGSEVAGELDCQPGDATEGSRSVLLSQRDPGRHRARALVCGRGAAQGDLSHWRFESVDLVSLLRPGNSVIAVVVWNFGEVAPTARQSIVNLDDSCTPEGITIRTAALAEGQLSASHRESSTFPRDSTRLTTASNSSNGDLLYPSNKGLVRIQPELQQRSLLFRSSSKASR